MNLVSDPPIHRHHIFYFFGDFSDGIYELVSFTFPLRLFNLLKPMFADKRVFEFVETVF
jgi:hypothetical protein